MARLPRFPEENRPYFVTTAATAGRLPIFEDYQNAETMVTVLADTRARYGFHLLGYAIMPDHFHLVIVAAARNDISQVMRYIKGRYARLHNERYGSAGPVWQSSFYDRAVRDQRALNEILSYIFANPVRRGLVRTPEDYRSPQQPEHANRISTCTWKARLNA